MQIAFTRTESNAIAPVDRRTHLELFACNFEDRDVIIPPRGAATIQTGIKLQLPPGVIGHLVGRRSNAEACRLATGAALVKDDCDSPLELRMHNDTDLPFTVVHGEPLAHLVPICISEFALAEIEASAAAPAAQAAAPTTEAAPADTVTETAEAAPAADAAEPAPAADALATDKPAE